MDYKDCLDAAISKEEPVVYSIPVDHPDRAKWLHLFGIGLWARYNRTGNMDDLEAAISETELAISITPADHPDRAVRLKTHGALLSTRYNRTGNMDDLEEAISKVELAISITPIDHLARAGILDNLASILWFRYTRKGNIDDLEAAISKSELAVSTTPVDHLDRAQRLSNLGNKLSDRYDRTGNIDDLTAAISKSELAVSVTPINHPFRALHSSNLGSILLYRYTRTGNMDDLEAAIYNAESAVSITPIYHPNQAEQLHNLGVMLSARYNRTRNIDDLKAAISKAELAVSISPIDHPNRAKQLNNLGSELSDRYDRTGNIDDLEAAISKAELAVYITPKNHPDRAIWLHNLGASLAKRYNRTRNIDDLEAAICKMELAVSITPRDHSDQALWLQSLGSRLSDRFYRTGKIGDLQAALESFTSSFDLSSALPLTRVQSARRAIHILVSIENWDRASSLAQAALKLLPFICDRYLGRTDQQYAILQISGLAADACSLSLRIGHVHEALQQLEFGRGIILGYLMDGRSDLAQLQNDYPGLANEYEALRFKAYTDISAKEPIIREQLHRERREAASRLEDCLHQIRQKDGYERFLMDPTLDELKQSAIEGPIIIVNATDFGCDAIIVSTSEVQAIALPEMNSSKAPPFFKERLGRYKTIDPEQLKKYERDVESDLGSVKLDIEADVEYMSWLWSSCVKPILKVVTDNRLSDSNELLRVWWIGAGIAGSFPFHAAGQYIQGVENIRDYENTLSQIIPSYTPTIKALSYARSCASRAAKVNGNETSILVVAMPTTPKHRSLPGVDREKLAIQQMTRDFCRIKALESPTAKRVLEDMGGYDIVHFACHGSADPKDPSNSHLLLQTSGPSGPVVDELTVSDISKKNTLGRTLIAYLSACSTAGVEASKHADECLHIASAFQVAGFAHVIGSLWPADDDVCVRLAESFYRSLAKTATKHSNRDVAEAYRNAILEIRSKFASPSLWGSFTHWGA